MNSQIPKLQQVIMQLNRHNLEANQWKDNYAEKLVEEVKIMEKRL